MIRAVSPTNETPRPDLLRFVSLPRIPFALAILIFVAASPGSARGGSVVALAFDGKNDYVEISSGPVLGSKFTEEAWILPQSKDTGYHGFLGSQSPSNKRAPGLWVGYGAGIHGGFGDGVNWNSVAAPDVLILDSWNHVAATYDGKTYRVFANGIEVLTREFALTPIAQPVTEIGRSGNFFVGAIRDVRLWKRALSVDEIKEGMTNTLTGKEEGLAAYFPLDDGAGSTARNTAAPGSFGTLKNGPRWITSSAAVAVPNRQSLEARMAVKAYSPSGNDVTPDSAIQVTLRKNNANVDAKRVRLELDNAPVSPEIGRDREGDMVLRYEPAEGFIPGTQHTVKVLFARANATGTNEFSYRFGITQSILLSK